MKKWIVTNLLRDVKGINWPKEMKIAGKLLELYPKMKWPELVITSKPITLVYFLTEKAHAWLKKEEAKQNFQIDEAPKYEIGLEKLGEDKKFSPKMTFRDFVKN